MHHYLSKIIDTKRKEMETRLKMLENAYHTNMTGKNKFSACLKNPHLSVIAEIKRRSPSVGDINSIINPIDLAKEYCQGGANAISVLTDVSFGGTLEDLKSITNAIKNEYSDMSFLRKDFIIHPLQIFESYLAGASAVLLIVKILGKELENFLAEAQRMGMEALVEVHDLNELEIALNAGSCIVGVNHRNLDTFEIDMAISKNLRSYIPSNVVTIAESGIQTSRNAQQMYELGYDAILVGEALVRSQNPGKLIQSMKEQYES